MIRLDMDTTVLYERQEVKMQPFYWILTFQALFVLLVLGIGLIVFPFYLYKFSAIWATVCLIIGLPLGFYFIKVAWKDGRKRIWENCHLDRYRLLEHGFDYEQYEVESRTKHSAFVAFSKVEAAVASKFIAKYHYAYKQSGFFEKQPYAHIFPVLFFVYSEEGARKLARVYFKDEDSIDLWLEQLRKHSIPIRITVDHLDALKEEQLLNTIEQKEETWPFMDFSDSGDDPGRTNESPGTFYYRFQQLAVETAKKQAYEQREERLEEAKAQSALPLWLPFVLQAIGLALLYGAADHGLIAVDNWWICLVMLLAGYAMFIYLLRKTGLWKAILHIVISSVVLFIVIVFGIETGAEETEAFIDSLLLAYFIYIPASFILYPFIIKLRQRRSLKSHLRR
ncbi:hypothetical protein [Paenibacillus sp. J2TS4]|uniref:hypothetical protein n=1 Tax=Paenibacillus sp. J2TS4 TaxID=2807194 RepID=UPI001B1EAF0F|nr:hypothetical protein [Paenibacillus sp. J2TS4]GIP35735.1 hypothetical protein J2TS4_49450 [Paenibacillus sp. J2TS4]